MSNGANVVTVHILDKEYRIACPPEDQEELLRSAAYLGKKMKDIRDKGKVIGTDRIAVMAALNITHELIKCQTDNEFHSSSLGGRIRNLQNKIDAALHDAKQIDL